MEIEPSRPLAPSKRAPGHAGPWGHKPPGLVGTQASPATAVLLAGRCGQLGSAEPVVRVGGGRETEAKRDCGCPVNVRPSICTGGFKPWPWASDGKTHAPSARGQPAPPTRAQGPAWFTGQPSAVFCSLKELKQEGGRRNHRKKISLKRMLPSRNKIKKKKKNVC